MGRTIMKECVLINFSLKKKLGNCFQIERTKKKKKNGEKSKIEMMGFTRFVYMVLFRLN